jgi:CPA1 family monovalent cation:H+ antiporter
VKVPQLDPAVVLLIALPPLLFDAAFRLDTGEVRRVAAPVLLLAVPGVLVSTLVVGAAVWLILDLPFKVGLLFGSLVAATDPVAVVGIFKHLHVPKRLLVIAEAESLVNDGTAATLYTALVAIVVTAGFGAGDIVDLAVRQVAGGVAIGLALGFGFSRLQRHTDDHLIEMTLSTALAYGSFLLADQVGASGILACVAAGFIHGSYGREIGMSPESRLRLDDLWEYLGFLANSFVFLLVGFSVHVHSLVDDAWPVTVAIVAAFVARVVTLAWPEPFPRRRALLTLPERSVLVWAGLRGGLTITLALSLPGDTPSRSTLIAMAIGVVLFTVVVQGLTLQKVIQWAGLAQPADEPS